MSQLNRLKSAIEFFDSNKNQSQKKENEQLWVQGRQNVDREFDQLLNKCSETTTAFLDKLEKEQPDSSSSPMSDASKIQFKENDISQIVSIIDWFKQVEPVSLDKLYEKLMKARNQLILDRIKKLKESKQINSSITKTTLVVPNQQQRRISTMNANSSTASLLSLVTEEKKSTIRSRLTENIMSSTNNLGRKKSQNITVNELGAMNSNSLSRNNNQYVIEQDFETDECLRFVLCMRETLKMFTIENVFIHKIIDEKEKVVFCKIVERIFDPVLRFLKAEVEKLAGNMKQITSKLTSKYVVAMFTVLSDLVTLKKDFLSIFNQSILITKTARHISNSIEQFLEIFITIERACASTLNDIIEEVKNDPKPIQPNGNIHSLTTETISFAQDLLPYDVIAGLIANFVLKENTAQSQLLPSEVEIKLRRDTPRDQPFDRIAYFITDPDDRKQCKIALSNYYDKLFNRLRLNLKKKADNYEDQTLKWIFLLNNTYKLSKLFVEANQQQQQQQQRNSELKPTINGLFMLAGKNDFKQILAEEIRSYKREYSACWSKLLSYIQDLNQRNPFSDLRLKEKERQLLKERFSGFNKEFDDIYETQKNYKIPAEQSELARELIVDNDFFISSQYKQFYETYSRMAFTANREKYVKYTPEDLKVRFQEFFSGY